jgi:hypothetical protein
LSDQNLADLMFRTQLDRQLHDLVMQKGVMGISVGAAAS